MRKLILVRHGESIWNQENRFTGWTDVDLSQTGRDEAHQASQALNAAGVTFGVAWVSTKRLSASTSRPESRWCTSWTPSYCRFGITTSGIRNRLHGPLSRWPVKAR